MPGPSLSGCSMENRVWVFTGRAGLVQPGDLVRQGVGIGSDLVTCPVCRMSQITTIDQKGDSCIYHKTPEPEKLTVLKNKRCLMRKNGFLDFVHFEGMLSEVHGQANAHIIPFLFLSTLLFIS